MTDIEGAILYVEQFSNGEWEQFKKTISSCSETRYCLDSCHQKCSVADILHAIVREDSKEQAIAFLREVVSKKKDELGSKPLYCLEQGYCALYCISSCQYGTFIRALTRERALEYNIL
ncbi:MAG: hypothetical protein K6T91_10910 [Firmicutes bacterium]|nr:hypothetical protein [Bacillota bacterium]